MSNDGRQRGVRRAHLAHQEQGSPFRLVLLDQLRDVNIRPRLPEQGFIYFLLQPQGPSRVSLGGQNLPAVYCYLVGDPAG